jgi:hypothetical protein
VVALMNKNAFSIHVRDLISGQVSVSNELGMSGCYL